MRTLKIASPRPRARSSAPSYPRILAAGALIVAAGLEASACGGAPSPHWAEPVGQQPAPHVAAPSASAATSAAPMPIAEPRPEPR